MAAELEIIYADPNIDPKFEPVGIGEGIQQPNPCYIGSGPASTIPIDDPDVLDPHLMLTGDEEGNFELYAFDLAQVSVDGQPLLQKNMRLQPWSEVRLGKCVLYLKPNDKNSAKSEGDKPKDTGEDQPFVDFNVAEKLHLADGRSRYDFEVKSKKGNIGVLLSVRLMDAAGVPLTNDPSELIKCEFEPPSAQLSLVENRSQPATLVITPHATSKLRAGTYRIQIQATREPLNESQRDGQELSSETLRGVPKELSQLSEKLDLVVNPFVRFRLSDLKPLSHWLFPFRNEAYSTLSITNDGNTDVLFLLTSRNGSGSDCSVQFRSQKVDETNSQGEVETKATRRRRRRTVTGKEVKAGSIERADGWDPSTDSWENFLVKSGKSRDVTIAVSPRSRPPISWRRERQQVDLTVGPMSPTPGVEAQTRTLRLSVSPSLLGPLRIGLVSLAMLAVLIGSIYLMNAQTKLTATAQPARVREFSSLMLPKIQISRQLATESSKQPSISESISIPVTSALTLTVTGSAGEYDLRDKGLSQSGALTFATYPSASDLQLTLTGDFTTSTNLLMTPTLQTGRYVNVNLQAPVTLTVISNPRPIGKTDGILAVGRGYSTTLRWECGPCAQITLERMLVTGESEVITPTVGSNAFPFTANDSARYRLTASHLLGRIIPWPPFVTQREIEVRVSDDAAPSGTWGVQPASAPKDGKVTVFWDNVDRASKLIVYANGVPNVIAEKDITTGKWEMPISADTTFSVTAFNDDAGDVRLRTAAGGETTTVTLALPPPPPPPPPQIVRFEITPTEVISGERVLVQWEVAGDPDTMTVTLASDGIVAIVPPSGFIYQRPDSSGDVLRIFQLVADNGGAPPVMAVKQVNVKFTPPTPTPLPTPTPAKVGKPNYDKFCGGEGRADLVQGFWQWECKSAPGKVINDEACRDIWETAYAKAEDRTNKDSWECWR